MVAKNSTRPTAATVAISSTPMPIPKEFLKGLHACAMAASKKDWLSSTRALSRHSKTGKAGRKMTRQRRWQIKMVRKGKCKICGALAVTKFHCEKHRLAVNTRARAALHKRDTAKRRYAGAEYASGDHAATVFHFPKWLLAEPFVLQYSPETGNFSCMLLNSENKVIGIGKSVTQAAKRSLRDTP
jgi:hypothetical protein